VQPLDSPALTSSPPDCHWPLYITLQTLTPAGWASADCWPRALRNGSSVAAQLEGQVNGSEFEEIFGSSRHTADAQRYFGNGGSTALDSTGRCNRLAESFSGRFVV